MSKIREFFERRAAGLARERELKNKSAHKEQNKAVQNKAEEKTDLDADLTDDEFWYIFNTFIKRINNKATDPQKILLDILKDFTPKKIEQFGKRYQELNK